jgi:hypothetical protein
MSDTRVDQLIANEVEHAVDHLMMGSDHQARPVPRYRAEDVARQLAEQVRQIMQSEYELALLTSDDVAAILHVTARRVRALAATRQVGWQAGRGVWVFRPQDVDRLRPGPHGRPRTTTTLAGGE